ncbi:MAG TPA: 2-succinyl-5-enolpyruvyl-6-hydroxy-3-cyclohexene-1-carboxylic-acid synthase [Gemmatimonadaceae bacterium]
MTESPDRAAYAFVGAFVDELSRAGVRHVCIAPGSRSTPLALMMEDHPGIQTWMHLDERCGAFFASGMARALREPVALVCTSGTAAANFFPAIVEANAAGVPLLVFTADRPPELRDVGAGQTIDQNQLYGAHAKWFVEVALPEASPAMLRYARTLSARAVATAASNPAGPVHLNFPFREPLLPSRVDSPSGLSAHDALPWTGRPDGEPWVRATQSSVVPDEATVARLAALIRSSERPLIVCGPQQDEGAAATLGELATAIGAPLLADPLSQARWGAHDRSNLIDRYDAILRHPRAADSLEPDFILRIGAVPTSKALFQWIERQTSARVVVVDAARWPDPSLSAHDIVRADARLLCESLLSTAGAGKHGQDWLQRWQSANDIAGGALVEHSGSLNEAFEGSVLAEIVACLPDRATLFASSSMPVRDLDTFGEGDARAIRVLANRGANGIDGVVSSALGAAAALRGGDAGPLVLAIGDIAFYHDMNGLLAAKLHSLDATIVVINNDGGGIFSFLPQAGNGDHFEKLFGTPHGLGFAAAAELYGGVYSVARDMESLRAAVAAGVRGKGLHIVEIRTERARNVVLHRQAVSAVARALDDHWH